MLNYFRSEAKNIATKQKSNSEVSLRSENARNFAAFLPYITYLYYRINVHTFRLFSVFLKASSIFSKFPLFIYCRRPTYPYVVQFPSILGVVFVQRYKYYSYTMYRTFFSRPNKD